MRWRATLTRRNVHLVLDEPGAGALGRFGDQAPAPGFLLLLESRPGPYVLPVQPLLASCGARLAEVGRELGAAADTEARVGAPKLVGDRVPGEAEARGDLLVLEPLQRQRHDARLARGQLREQLAGLAFRARLEVEREHHRAPRKLVEGEAVRRHRHEPLPAFVLRRHGSAAPGANALARATRELRPSLVSAVCTWVATVLRARPSP